MKHTPAQFPGPNCQAQTLASKLLAQHTIFFLKVVDDILLALVQQAGVGNQEQPKGIKCQMHGAIVAPGDAAKSRARLASEPRI